MKIDNLKINGFGKLKEKEINFSDGINIIFGENESGKSSMLKFISSMFYGTSKNKNGKEISDFEKYKPWQTEEFSGKIEYTLDNGEKYEIYREFKKKNPIIYNSKKENISKSFTIDKTKGIDFFTEQTGIDEETFFSTAITEQEGVKLSKSSQMSIIQKISNLISSGDDNISFKKSLEKINKRQNEEIGTERTSQKPINIIDNKINKLLEEKKKLEIYKENIYDNSIEKEQLKLEQKSEEIKKEFLKEVKINLENNRLKNAEINFNKNLESDFSKKIDELNNKIYQNRQQEKKGININKKYNILIPAFIIIFIVLMIVSPYKLINCIIIFPIIFVLYKRFKKKNIYSGKEKVLNEIEILKQNREFQSIEAKEKEDKLLNEIKKKNKELEEKYIKYLDFGFIEDILEKDYEEILKEIDIKENQINRIKFKLHTMETNSDEVNNKLENLAKIEEEIQDSENQKEELLSLNNSYNIAKECLEKAYEQVKENISPKFTKNLCNIISEISDKKYTNIYFTDNEGLNVEIYNGNYMPASRLSVGTIDQMYISLRLTALKEISNEKMPIILDEAFAYFDNDRLENMLNYLNNSFFGNQVLIFTCSNREKDIFNNLNIKYNLINL